MAEAWQEHHRRDKRHENNRNGMRPLTSASLHASSPAALNYHGDEARSDGGYKPDIIFNGDKSMSRGPSCAPDLFWRYGVSLSKNVEANGVKWAIYRSGKLADHALAMAGSYIIYLASAN